jgi:hypothetical protein
MSGLRDRKRPDTKPNRGTVIGYGQAQASDRQNRVMATEGATVPEGHGRCPLCGKILQLRQDGTLRGHRSTEKIPCLGATPTDGRPRQPRGEQ